MFQAVRRWWQSGRGKETSRLFVFELTVVMIGVLAAQQVSNWASNRSQMQEVEGLHANLVHSFGQYQNISRTYDVAIPCFNERVDVILRQAAQQGPVDPALLKYSPLMLMGPDEISADNFRLLRSRYGDREADLIGSVQFNLSSMETNGRALEAQWYDFQRINPQHGPVSSDDRAAVRAAAVKIKGYLATLQKGADNIQNLTGLMGIQLKPNAKLRPVSSCAEIWRSGAAFVEGKPAPAR